jgi:Lon-like protease
VTGEPSTALPSDGAPPGPDLAAPDRPRRTVSVLRSVFYTLSTAVIIAAGFVVPLPMVETQPGTPTEIAPLVEIDGAEVTELSGSTSLLTIRQQEQGVLPALWIMLDDDRTLRPVEEVYPPGVDIDEYLEAQRERFRRQFDIAAALGARAAGVEVELHTEVVVHNVLAGSPADGVLSQGDVIRAVDGEPLGDAEPLQEITRTGSEGQQLTLTIVRDGQEQEITATLGAIPGEDGPRLGIMIVDGVEQLQLPFEIRLGDTRIGGPSAGLMVAVTVYDLLSEDDLLRGRIVMGTGSLGADGTVGPVGGVPEKMRAAADHGADLVLVPQSLLDEARGASPEGLRIVGVRTLDEALEVLAQEPA